MDRSIYNQTLSQKSSSKINEISSPNRWQNVTRKHLGLVGMMTPRAAATCLMPVCKLCCFPNDSSQCTRDRLLVIYQIDSPHPKYITKVLDNPLFRWSNFASLIIIRVKQDFENNRCFSRVGACRCFIFCTYFQTKTKSFHQHACITQVCGFPQA